MFTLPDGSSFDPDFGLGQDSPGLNPVNDPSWIIKANSVLDRYGYAPIDPERDFHPVKELSSEVGDDEESVSNSKAFAALLPVFHEKFGMQVSWEDTSISSRFGNLAEDLVILPSGYAQTYLNVRNTSAERDMAYLDVPKLRLGIAVRPGRMDHSSTNDGKASLVGARNAWLPSDSPVKVIYEIFSLYQDINLGLKRDKRFAYLPQSLGGYGKPVPFREPSNFERFNLSFKQGVYSELNREIVRRTIVYLHNESLGFSQDRDLLLGHIVRFESQYHDWIKGRSIWCPVAWVDIPENLAKHSAGKLGRNRAVNAALIRLASEGRLLTESKLAVAVEHNELCKALLGTEKISDFKARRDAAIKQWRTLSIYGQESYGYIKELSLDGYGRSPLRAVEVLRFWSLVRDKRYNLKTLLRDESFYWKDAIDEIYDYGPMKVRFNAYPKTGIGHRTFAEWERDVIDTEDIEGIQLLENWVRNGFQGPIPTRMINDDDAILTQAKPECLVLLITEDRNLCRDTNRVVGCPVIRVPVNWYYRSLYFGDASEPWVATMKEKYPSMDIQCIPDEGSIQSYEELFFHDGVMLKRRNRQPLNIFRANGERDPLDIEESDFFDDGPPPGRPDVFDRRNVLGLRKRYKRAYARHKP